MRISVQIVLTILGNLRVHGEKNDSYRLLEFLSVFGVFFVQIFVISLSPRSHNQFFMSPWLKTTDLKISILSFFTIKINRYSLV